MRTQLTNCMTHQGCLLLHSRVHTTDVSSDLYTQEHTVSCQPTLAGTVRTSDAYRELRMFHRFNPCTCLSAAKNSTVQLRESD